MEGDRGGDGVPKVAINAASSVATRWPRTGGGLPDAVQAKTVKTTGKGRFWDPRGAGRRLGNCGKGSRMRIWGSFIAGGRRLVAGRSIASSGKYRQRGIGTK